VDDTFNSIQDQHVRVILFQCGDNVSFNSIQDQESDE